jgi:hypothetical protein
MADNEKRVYQSDTLTNINLILVDQKQQKSERKPRAKDFYHNQLTNEERVNVVNRIIDRLKKD